MRGNLRARRPPGRAVLALIAASVLMVLAGCASASSGTTASTGNSASPGPAGPAGAKAAPTRVPASAGLPLCAGTRQPDQVVLRLTAAHAREILPRAATVTDTARVRALAAALCGLPRIPRGLHCPAALPGAVLLEFSAQGHAYARLLIHDSGCASVTGLGAARQWSWSSRPGRLLGQAVGGKGRLIPGTHPSSVPLQ
jgi:uncharacterized protein YceK